MLTLWNPWKSLGTVDRFFDDFFAPIQVSPAEQPVWKPAVDVLEEQTRFLVKVDLPEVEKEQLKVNVEENVLTIEGERRTEREEKQERYAFRERFVGTFRRSFRLPENVDADGIGAKYKDGVLTVTIPKIAAPEPKTIDVAVH